jgi:hypothetical protein
MHGMRMSLPSQHSPSREEEIYAVPFGEHKQGPCVLPPHCTSVYFGASRVSVGD